MLQLFLLLVPLLASPEPITAVRVESGPEIDGRLDDQVWSRAQLCRCNFSQYGPDYGEDMTEPTEIRVLYDDSNIYFGFFMSDPDQESMLEALTPRDDYITGEWIAILLDTWGDGIEATSFEVSLANSQMDSKISPEGNWDYSWDSVWESGTARVDSGWTAEVAIPFSCLRFDSDCPEQTWSVNFQRILSRTSENGWYSLSCSGPMADLENFAELRGIRGIQGSLGAELRPYAAGRTYHFQGDDSRDNDFDAGGDVKVGLGSGLAADFTVNPDFGQVEADEAEMNLSHFELFRREKRPFFLESANLFNMPFNMFYSRRIGAVAPNLEVIPIIGGAKVSGSLGGGYRIGFLDAVTSRISQDGEILVPAGNFGIFRTVREFSAFSYLGFSAVSRETWKQDSLESSHSRAMALDGALEVPGSNLLEFSAAGSWNTGMENDAAYSISLERIRSMVGYSVGGEYVGDNFDVNATGYTTATGYWSTWLNFWRNVRPENTFSEFGYSLGGEYSQQTDGEITGRNAHVESWATLKNGINFGGEFHYYGEAFDPYEGPQGRTYGDHSDIYLRLGTNSFDAYYLWSGFGAGQWEDGGTFRDITVKANIRPTNSLELGAQGNLFTTSGGTNWNWEIEDWDTRDTHWRSLVFRANYIFNPDLNLRLFSQYSRFSTDFSRTAESSFGEIRANVLFSWQYMPGSMVYVLAENVFPEKQDGGFGAPDLGMYAKVTWYLPI